MPQGPRDLGPEICGLEPNGPLGPKGPEINMEIMRSHIVGFVSMLTQYVTRPLFF